MPCRKSEYMTEAAPKETTKKTILLSAFCFSGFCCCKISVQIEVILNQFEKEISISGQMNR
jgi:hypothetical protein